MSLYPTEKIERFTRDPGLSATSFFDQNDVYANMSGIMLARVLSINYATRTLTCIGVLDQLGSAPLYNVRIMSSNFSQKEGSHWLPVIDTPDANAPGGFAAISGKRDAIAVIAFVGGTMMHPICIGFVDSGSSELSFPAPGLRLERHSSNIYERWTQEGLYEFSFPDGTYIKICRPEDGELLTKINGRKDASGNPVLTGNIDVNTHPWYIPKSTKSNIYVLNHGSGTKMKISEQGIFSVTDNTNGNFTLGASGGFIKTKGQFYINSESKNTSIDGIIIKDLLQQIDDFKISQQILFSQVNSLWQEVSKKQNA